MGGMWVLPETRVSPFICPSVLKSLVHSKPPNPPPPKKKRIYIYIYKYITHLYSGKPTSKAHLGFLRLALVAMAFWHSSPSGEETHGLAGRVSAGFQWFRPLLAEHGGLP